MPTSSGELSHSPHARPPGQAQLFHFQAAGVTPKRVTKEFPVTADALLEPGEPALHPLSRRKAFLIPLPKPERAPTVQPWPWQTGHLPSNPDSGKSGAYCPVLTKQKLYCLWRLALMFMGPASDSSEDVSARVRAFVGEWAWVGLDL